MFRTLINDAKAAVGAVIGKYAIRASVAVPFLVAAGFATAAVTLALVERFGAIIAYCSMAAGFAIIGLLAAAAVSVREQEEEAADSQPAKTGDAASDAAAQITAQAPLALLGTLLATPHGPSMAVGGAKMAARNLPLVLLLVIVGLLFWPSPESSSDEASASDAGKAGPDADPPRDWQTTGNGVDRRAD